MSRPEAGAPVIPETMRAFVLDGTGLEHAAVRRIPIPTPGPWQLVGRVDAAGICSSVDKVIAQGPGHSLMYGRDLAAHPAVLGDEGVITVVALRLPAILEVDRWGADHERSLTGSWGPQ